ncbi:phytanoyl-CoA dioxygenase, partial [Nadsonia fulvescens var. elongata DSM 6958]
MSFESLDMTEIGLNEEQLKDFDRDGYIVIPGELTHAQVSSLIAESHKLLNEFSIDDHPMTKFTTGDNAKDVEATDKAHVGDSYFLESSDKIRFFFEEDAFDSNGKLLKPKDKAINKIGHHLHKLNNMFRSVSLTKRNEAIAQTLGYQDPRILQSMLICKQPEIGGAVPSHQDAVFLYTEPQSAIGWWYALEDCTTKNGALSFVPGSHKKSPIAKRFVRLDKLKTNQENTETSEIVNAKFGTTFIPIPGIEASPEPKDEDFKLLDCKAGSLVLIHNSVLHK